MEKREVKVRERQGKRATRYLMIAPRLPKCLERTHTELAMCAASQTCDKKQAHTTCAGAPLSSSDFDRGSGGHVPVILSVEGSRWEQEGAGGKVVQDLDLLAARKQVGKRHSADARHLGVVDDAHELLHQPLRQVRVLEAVDRQPAARLRVARLGPQTRTDSVSEMRASRDHARPPRGAHTRAASGALAARNERSSPRALASCSAHATWRTHYPRCGV
eukprot:3294701-Pleurochrysis_carterae.AAC.1